MNRPRLTDTALNGLARLARAFTEKRDELGQLADEKPEEVERLAANRELEEMDQACAWIEQTRVARGDGIVLDEIGTERRAVAA